ncbi:hypothetical protein B0H13DRAFT_388538 [Mycena leptocephala]|nr:hypothetical protein B0H13DRAFT_388538 [Mycena leptocephala]
MDIDPVSLRSQCDHFRILVIGRANAGKTTLLKQVCQSIVDPEILDPDGNKLDPKLVEGSDSRGLHDINNQLIFKSNPGYIFHDSRGFESGSLEETNKVKSFIAMRAGIGALSEQLHAIWYCLPTDTTRPLLKADEHFFGTDVTGKVPVIAILTKCDAIDDEAFQALLIETGNLPDQALVDLRVREMLDRRFVGPLKRMPYHPADYAEVMNMQEDGDCHDLITKTAGALTDEVLRLLFVSVQQNNIDLCIRYAVERTETSARMTINFTVSCAGHWHGFRTSGV